MMNEVERELYAAALESFDNAAARTRRALKPPRGRKGYFGTSVPAGGDADDNNADPLPSSASSPPWTFGSSAGLPPLPENPDWLGRASSIPWVGQVQPGRLPQGPAADPFEQATARIRRSVMPVGGRQEGATTKVLDRFVPHVLENLSTLPQRAIHSSETLRLTGEYDPGPILETAGLVMPGSFGAPRGSVGSGLTRPPRSLPMDEASRMARADRYFPVEAHHATLNHFPAFERSPLDIGIHFGTPGQAADRLAQRAESGFRMEGAHVMPVRLNLRNPLRVQDFGLWLPPHVMHNLDQTKLFTREEIVRAVRSAEDPRGELVALQNLIKSKGYDGLVYKNLNETTGGAEARKEMNRLADLAARTSYYDQFRLMKAEDSHAIFHPRQARLRSAAFDPFKLNSSNLKAGFAVAAGIPPALLADALVRWKPQDDERTAGYE